MYVAPAAPAPVAPVAPTAPITLMTSQEQTELRPSTTNGPRAARNFPLAANWLRSLADDLERGRDAFDYLSLIPVFASNDIARLDDVDALKKEGLIELGLQTNVQLKIGLVNRIVRYAAEDVKKINEGTGW